MGSKYNIYIIIFACLLNICYGQSSDTLPIFEVQFEEMQINTQLPDFTVEANRKYGLTYRIWFNEDQWTYREVLCLHRNVWGIWVGTHYQICDYHTGEKIIRKVKPEQGWHTFYKTAKSMYIECIRDRSTLPDSIRLPFLRIMYPYAIEVVKKRHLYRYGHYLKSHDRSNIESTRMDILLTYIKTQFPINKYRREFGCYD